MWPRLKELEYKSFQVLLGHYLNMKDVICDTSNLAICSPGYCMNNQTCTFSFISFKSTYINQSY